MWSGVESGSLCMTLTDQHSWKGIWWDWVSIAIGRSGFDTVVVNWCPFIRSERKQQELNLPLEKPIAPIPTVWMATGSPPWYQIQTYQLLSTLNPTGSHSRNAGLSMLYTNYLIPPQTTSTANLKLHTNLSSNHDTPPVSTSVNSPNSALAPEALNSFDSVTCILLLRKATVIWPKVYIFVSFHLYMF